MSVQTREDFKPQKPLLSQIGTDLMVGHVDDQPTMFLVRLGLRFHTEGVEERANLPYDLSIAVRGFFQAPHPITPLEIPAPLVLNAVSILYGIARGHVGQTTGTFPHGPMTLPAATFVDLIERAARTEGTGIAITTEMVKSNEPLASEFFRFKFAVEDLPSLIRTVEEEKVQAELQNDYEQLTAALNEMPMNAAGGESQVVEVVRRMMKRIEELPSPGTGVVRPALTSILSMLDQLGRIKAAGGAVPPEATEALKQPIRKSARDGTRKKAARRGQRGGSKN